MSTLPKPEDDGLIIPDVGMQSADKHYYLVRYIDIFTNGMKNQRWTGLHYIDLFAGAGIERVEGNLDWGSPLIAAQTKALFSQLHLVELNKEKYSALSQRLEAFPQPNLPQLICGDANEKVRDIVSELSARSLSLAFLDPYGLHLKFETLKILAQRRVDLLIFFPDHLDALRNWNAYYSRKPDSNLTQVLGTDCWEKKLENSNQNRHADLLRDIYIAQLKRLGYVSFDFVRICRKNGRFLYRLIFCSKHERGGDFFKKISLKQRDGQTTFDF